jgi:hypothetical protein
MQKGNATSATAEFTALVHCNRAHLSKKQYLASFMNDGVEHYRGKAAA